MSARQDRAEQGASLVEMTITIALISLAIIASVSAGRDRLVDAFCSVDLPGTRTCPATPLADVRPAPDPEPETQPEGPQDWQPELVPGSEGTMRFNTATVDQDQRLDCLSIRFNMSWFPSNWNGYRPPQTVVLDITWSADLDVAEIIPGSDGDWQFRRIATNHLRFARTGDFDSSGFQPEPEILLSKSDTHQQVQVTFVATAALTPTVTATSSTWSVPY